MNIIKKLVVLAVCVAAASVANFAKAQTPQGIPYLAGTIWVGSEDVFQLNGKLGFAFSADGKVVMADAHTVSNNPKTFIHGRWFQNGSLVEIRFSNCVYRGQLNGNYLSGTAQGNGLQWAFRLQFAKQ